jgi:hypothetical protein
MKVSPLAASPPRDPAVTERAKLSPCLPGPAFLLAFALAAVAACERSGTAVPVYDTSTRELVRIDSDVNSDGRTDVRTSMQNGRAARLEGDTNGDGRPDRWEYYDAAGRLERIGGSSQQDGREDTWAYTSGTDVRMDISTLRDGVIDRREFYRGHRLRRTERDTNHDGLMDTWEEFEGGRLTLVAIDEDRRHGRPTRRVRYGTGGGAHVEIDPDGDGRFSPAVAATPEGPAR